MASSTIKQSFGNRDGEIVHVSSVPRGLECNCVCPCCEAPLVAKKGEVRTAHFAHASGKDCKHGLQTSLHIAAKRVLEESRCILLPPAVVRVRNLHWEITPTIRVQLDEVRLEKRFHNIVPDVICTAKGRTLIVEIAVTHFVDEAKLSKIETAGVSAVEIDLSKCGRDLDFLTLRDLVIDSPDRKKWIFNSRFLDLEDRLSKCVEPMPVVERGFAVHVDDCPIRMREWRGKFYANVMDDCSSCEYCADYDHDSLFCIARRGKSLVAMLNELAMKAKGNADDHASSAV